MNKGFVGGTQDSTGLTHLGAREYDPANGRFISVDPVLDGIDPQSWNGYSYSGNNPVAHSDPTGLWWGSDLVDDVVDWTESDSEWAWDNGIDLLGGAADWAGADGLAIGEIGVGAVGEGVGAAADGTGIGAPLGIAIGAGAGALIGAGIANLNSGGSGDAPSTPGVCVGPTAGGTNTAAQDRQDVVNAKIANQTETKKEQDTAPASDQPPTANGGKGGGKGGDGVPPTPHPDDDEPYDGPKAAARVRENAAKSGNTIKQSRAVATARTDINGVRSESSAVSGTKNPPGTEGFPDGERAFSPSVRPDGIAPQYEAEHQLLEHIANGLPEGSTGTIDLYVENPVCDSCQGVIEQFQSRFPNIRLNVTHG
jgi:RHS repeat-associated protein